MRIVSCEVKAKCRYQQRVMSLGEGTIMNDNNITYYYNNEKLNFHKNMTKNHRGGSKPLYDYAI